MMQCSLLSLCRCMLFSCSSASCCWGTHIVTYWSISLLFGCGKKMLMNSAAVLSVPPSYAKNDVMLFSARRVDNGISPSSSESFPPFLLSVSHSVYLFLSVSLCFPLSPCTCSSSRPLPPCLPLSFICLGS